MANKRNYHVTVTFQVAVSGPEPADEDLAHLGAAIDSYASDKARTDVDDDI